MINNPVVRLKIYLQRNYLFFFWNLEIFNFNITSSTSVFGQFKRPIISGKKIQINVVTSLFKFLTKLIRPLYFDVRFRKCNRIFVVSML